jgi:hypothetical protein
MEGNRFFAAHTEISPGLGDPERTCTADFEEDSQFRILRHLCAERQRRWRSPGCRDGGRFLLRLLGRRRGHGVPAGVLMSMVKSAVRMRIVSVGPLADGLLPALNDVLQPLTSPSVYATALPKSSIAKAGNWAGSTWSIPSQSPRPNPFRRSLRASSALPKRSGRLPMTVRFCWCAILVGRNGVFGHHR